MIQIRGLNELIRLAGMDLGRAIRRSLHEIGERVKDRMATEPGPVKYPIQWASEKQRRYVMSLVRQYGPWSRESHTLSEKLLGSWQVTDQNDYTVMVSNPVSYGPWVQDADLQQPMHRNTGWVTDEQAVQQVGNDRDVDGIVGDEIGRLWGGA